MAYAYQHNEDPIKVKFDRLVEKLRNSSITFEWVEITREKFKIGDQMVEYILEIADPTIQMTAGYGDAYVIARVTPYEATVRYEYSGYSTTARLNRVIDDERTSYHLYLVNMRCHWIELAIHQAICSLPTTRVDDLIYKIDEEDQRNEVLEIITKLIDRDTECGVSIEDYLDDLVMYAG